MIKLFITLANEPTGPMSGEYYKLNMHPLKNYLQCNSNKIRTLDELTILIHDRK